MHTTERAAHTQEQDPLRFGKYELIKPLGIGGMALVWLATKPILGGSTKICALKMPADLIGLDPHKREAIENEIRIASQLSHSNIVQVFDAGSVGGVTYIELEHIDGVSLERFMETMRARGVAWSFSFACHIVREILEGLHYAHTFETDGVTHPIVHRDISPHNVLVSSAGEIKIMDFGIAKVNGDHTSGMHLKGKLGYMAPELLREDAGPQADLYAVGAVLYELVEGKRFREGRSIEDTIVRAVIEPRAEMKRVAVPEAVVSLYRGLTEPDPRQRIQSASEALQQMASWSGGGSERDGLRYLYRRCFGDARYSGKTEGCVEMPQELAAMLVALQGGETPTAMAAPGTAELTAAAARPNAIEVAEAATVQLPKEEPGAEAETTVHVRPTLASLAHSLAHPGEVAGELAPGAVVGHGRFRIERVIGRGGMATVYAACALSEMQMVAIKVPSADARGADGETRFANELLFGGIVGEHPNFVLPLHAGRLPELGDVPYLATELARGPALADVIAMERRLPPARAVAIGRDLATALDYLHQRGIVHRDLKPDNVLLVEHSGPTEAGGAREIAKLIDLGLATRTQNPDSARITGFHERPGTRPYMSPEQLEGAPARPSLDVFALGVTLHEMLVGLPPHEESRTHHAESSDPWVMRSRLPPDVPAALVDIVDACLASDAKRRPAASTVRRWLDDLASELLSAPREREALPPVREAVRPSPSQPWGLAAAVAVGLLVGAGYAHERSPAAAEPVVVRAGPPSRVDSQTSAIKDGLQRALVVGEALRGRATVDPPAVEEPEPFGPLLIEVEAPRVGKRPRVAADPDRCARVRESTAAAQRKGAHAQVLALVRHHECWSDESARVYAEVRALAGDRKWVRCVALGTLHSEDPRVRSVTAFCASRRGAQG